MLAPPEKEKGASGSDKTVKKAKTSAKKAKKK
jgi:hypothetical protein